MKGIAASVRRGLWLLSALLAACGPTAVARVCDPTILPYQYKVVTAEDQYFATLIPLSAAPGRQVFFLSEEPSVLRSADALDGGDPTGRVVTFERSGDALVAEALGLSFDDAEVGTLRSRSPAGVTRFEHAGASYSLWSCDGILSDRFQRSFPSLFH